MIKGGFQDNVEFQKDRERNVGDNGTPVWPLPTEPRSDLSKQAHVAPS